MIYYLLRINLDSQPIFHSVSNYNIWSYFNEIEHTEDNKTEENNNNLENDDKKISI